MDRLESNLLDYYNIPRICQKCGGVMVFKGVGEYHCELCDFVDYDDAGYPFNGSAVYDFY